MRPAIPSQDAAPPARCVQVAPAFGEAAFSPERRAAAVAVTGQLYAEFLEWRHR
jgi:hypothetical protein